MNSVAVVILLTLIAQAHANDSMGQFLDNLMDKLEVKFFDSTVKSSSLEHATLMKGAASNRLVARAAFNPTAKSHFPVCNLTPRRAQRTLHTSLSKTKLDLPELVLAQLDSHAATIFEGLSSKGYAFVDNFLPHETILAMREEATALRRDGLLKPSLTQMIDNNGAVTVLEKPGVFYHNKVFREDVEPNLFGYTHALRRHFLGIFKDYFPEGPVLNYLPKDKLQVMDEGTENPMHFDKNNPSDSRKLTTILYLQTNWNTKQGGCFRMFEAMDPNMEPLDKYQYIDTAKYVDIAPLGGRLLAFWADAMPHAVRPIYETSEDVHRWALTTWFHQDNGNFRLLRAKADWRVLEDEIQDNFPHLTQTQRKDSTDAAFVQNFGCTLQDKEKEIKREYGLHDTSKR